MRLVLVGDSFIPKGPWKLLWLVQAHRSVFGSVKLAPINYEKSFAPAIWNPTKDFFESLHCSVSHIDSSPQDYSIEKDIMVFSNGR